MKKRNEPPTLPTDRRNVKDACGLTIYAEDLDQGTTELALDLRLHLRERPRRYRVVEAAQPANEGLREVVGAGSDNLTELHEESAQVDAQVVEAARHRLMLVTR